MSSVRIYDKKMYCRAVENCQELTNQVFIFDMWKIGEMIGEKPEQHQYAVFFLPCCDRHIQERVAYAHKKIGGDLNGKV
jgi:hypothetical protein